jgi:hypothetical protein
MNFSVKYTLIVTAGLSLSVCFSVFSDSGKVGWEELYAGAGYVNYRIETEEGPVSFHAARIDLDKESVDVVVSPPRYIGKKTSTFAMDIGAQFAINGGFWTLVTHKPLGLLVSGGRKWKESKDDNEYGFLAVNSDGRAWISPPEDVQKGVPDDVHTVISGAPMIVMEGRVGKVNGCGYICMKHPRAAIGLDKSGKRLFMVVADGRQEDSASIDLETLAEFMIRIGVWNALNLDGGGSATLFVEKKGGVANDPCEGQERSVLNSLAVIIKEKVKGAGGPDANPRVVETAGTIETSLLRQVEFTNEDFENKGELEHPPRVVKAAGAAGLFSAVLIVLVVASFVIRRKRKKKSDAENKRQGACLS